ncbi:AAA family ATPase [Vibrio campbellii]|uniref:AAA family ATPase n=1 Tax=Vibrio campbellii TaxID=680 RepID=UPI0005EDF019|nr:ATP-binding protein [Vibrio campbellii]
MNNLIVFTGGPGSGKTSVIEHLTKLGYVCAPETGRKVIQHQVALGSDALPWKNKIAFRDEMVREEQSNYEAHKHHNEFVFFDRGIVDSYGYSQLESLPIPQALTNACEEQQYAKHIFIFPPWEAIFVNDEERKQNFSEAVRTYQVMVAAYERFGYTLIEVPTLNVEQRVQFILESLKGGPMIGQYFRA